MSRKLRSMVELKEFLKNPSPNLKVPAYDLNKEGRDVIMSTPKKEKMTLSKLAEIVNAGFKRIDTRLDYIVKANNLKDLPKNN